jgi:signal transduction histidine kinase
VTDPDAKKYIDIILSEVGRLEGIIHDNLAYIKNVAPQFSRTPLNGVIEEVLLVYEDEFRQRGIGIERELSPEVGSLDMDPQQIKQSVVNLVANAMEAMDKGGTLTVRTYPGADGQEVVMEIGDTGPGISPESMHNLFNPYYTTKVRGTGLGLSITHRIIKAHKGSILFRNKETGGAVFTIRLPVPQEKEQQPS